MAATQVLVGGAKYRVAQVWSTLPQTFFDRSCFFHMATGTIGHGELHSVLELGGGVRRGENFVAAYAVALQAKLGAISSDPVALSSETVTAQGRPLATLSPSGLKTSLISQPGPLLDLRPLRDRALDNLHAVYKQYGTSDQKKFLDSIANSQQQARMISDSVMNALGSLNDDGVDNQILAAILMFKMNITPCAMVHLDFGGDNHTDYQYAVEASRHQTAVASLAKMVTTLDTWGLSDKVTFAMLNVFGRSFLNPTSIEGRGHHGGHHVGIIMGKNTSASVVGGLALNTDPSVVSQRVQDYVAQSFRSATGQVGSDGDVNLQSSLGAFGQTLGVTLGVDRDDVADLITVGKVVESALRGV